MGWTSGLQPLVDTERLIQPVETLQHGGIVVQDAGMVGRQDECLLIVPKRLLMAAPPQ